MATVDQLMTVLQDTASLLQKTQVNLKKCSKARLTRGYVEARLSCIQEYWATFKRTHQELIKVMPREQRAVTQYFINEEYFIYEDLYLNIEGDLKDLLNSNTKQINPNISNSDNQVGKLPRIQLPSFSGGYEQWPTFKDLFLSIVHNNASLSNVQKLHYLKTSVSGEAEAILKHVQITESNYTQAWDILQKRYGNKKLIVNSILKRLFLQKKLNTQSATQLKSLLDTTTECLNSLQNLNMATDSWDPLIIFLVVQKLDPESHKDWEEYAHKDDSEELPKWTDFVKFLEAKFRTLELITASSSTPRERNVVKERTFHATESQAEKSCVMCKGNHTLAHCKEFTKMQPNERCEYTKNNRLCYNCLAPGHAVFKCRLPMSCRICRKRHHSLVHVTKSPETAEQDTKTQPTLPKVNETETEIQATMAIASHHTARHSDGLLATAIVNVKSEQGHTIALRALIDPCSQASFISEKATQLLKLKRETTRASITGLGPIKANANQVVQLEVSSQYQTSYSIQLRAYVISKQLTTQMPMKTMNTSNWSHIQNLHLADPSYNTPGPVDLLLGVKVYAQIIQEDTPIIKGPPGTPCAQKTYLGWILFGDNGETDTSIQEKCFITMHHQVDVDDLLKTIWEVEPDTKRTLTEEEQTCERIYESTYKRNEEGRYIVKLPLKTEVPRACEGNTREIAQNRLIQLERRFLKMPKLKEEYVKVIDDYIEQKHMEKVPTEEIHTKKSVYLAHHAIIREEKETTKTRVVYDASCKGTNGFSLNDDLLVGPVLQEDLRSLIMRWRMHAICFVSDIHKMYRMVLTTKEDSDYQRILWRSSSDKQIEDYRLLTVTFGTASAPYLAVKTLQQLAIDEGDEFPAASKMIKEDFYVDDLMSGCDTIEQAIEANNQLQEVMRKGGFQLKKWSSNSVEFMRSLKPEDRSANAHLDLNMDGTIKALGVQWNMGTDQFEYNLNLPEVNNHISKRTILSDIQKLFDPLGWISPCVLMAKILIQKLWLAKVNWDEEVSQPLKDEWLQLRADLRHVNEIRVDRWLDTLSTEGTNIQIHGFSDASISAYGAAVYIRVEKADGTVKTRLIASRTRVSPVKTVSLPRLELCGAVVLAKLLGQVSHAMRIPASQIFAWTDSSIVISWIFGEPQRWKTFVANRVVEITNNVSQNQWHHVTSEDNPADIASRGMYLSELKASKLWWEGPEWLTRKEIEYRRPNVVSTDIERKNVIQTNLNVYGSEMERNLTDQFKEFDNLQELIKTITYCRKFLNMKKLKIDNFNLTTHDLDHTLQICVQLVQKEEFGEEIDRLTTNKQVHKRSNIKSLNPYLEEGLLRVGGRLRLANINNEEKHPLILGNRNNLTPLIIADAHLKTLHGGITLTMSYLRSRFWIIKSKNLVRAHVNKCLVCVRQNAAPKPQLMGDLPRERVTPARPFLHSGVDFAGPFTTLMSKGRGAKTTKTYVAIFICLSVKCIHLELVSDLTSEAFIAAFKRFVARRGRCNHLWSDQGRNFVGANKELINAWKEAQLEFTGEISDSLAKDGTQWHFIPAYSPNFGGLWEAGVKSLKHHLKRIITSHLTFEEFNTVLCEIEACLNSRPLCPIDNDDTDSIEPLTPGHFLIGEAPINVPSPDLKDVRMSSLSRWQHTQKLVRDLWCRWQQEYLSRLQQRPKWLKRVEEFKEGQIVLIKTDNLPPGKWALGRIVAKHPGPDHITRVYSVKSGDSVTKRPVTKLCLLPIEIND
ncbi:uncharacterized protein LOC134652418 [Cydia amplana]|uniref:uncharacterized protein LOC134652418 n=1 Tax=Cydia amplana TaxID=1869771 RepID=UPI002FE5777B